MANAHERVVPLTLESTEKALQECQFAGGIAASALEGEFGASRITRDYLAVMGDLLPTHPRLVRQGFSQIPKEQGVTFDPATGEQHGRLPHQVAYNVWDGERVPEAIIASRRSWAERWGVPFNEDTGFVVWNQTDASRYIHELSRYVTTYGNGVLDDSFVHRPTGEQRSVRQAALLQLEWMVNAIENSSLGLLEMREFNPLQTSWSGVTRDGYDAYFHPLGPHGQLINKAGPVAYIENQGLAVQAFRDALDLFPAEQYPELAPQRKRWQEIAAELPARAFELFRWDDENYLVPAIDRDSRGHPRQVRLLSSATAETLATPELYHGVHRGDFDFRDILTGIITKVFSHEFMTPVGMRMLSRRHERYEGELYAYQGSKAVWPVTQWRIAEGLEQAGLPELAQHVRLQRVLPALETAGNFPELFYVSDGGQVAYRKASSSPDMRLAAEQWPSDKQAWTISGARAAFGPVQATSPATGWRKHLVSIALRGIKDTPTHSQTQPLTYHVDINHGKTLGTARYEAMGEIQ